MKAADAIAHDTSDPKKLDLIRKALSYRDRFFDRFGEWIARLLKKERR